VQKILTHVNHVTQLVKLDITKVFTKEQLSRANEVRHLHYALLHPSDSTLIKSLKYGLIVGTRLTKQNVYLYRLVVGVRPCCLAGKTKSPSFSESKNPSSLMPGHTVYVDLIPFTEMCIGGIQHHLLCLRRVFHSLAIVPYENKK